MIVLLALLFLFHLGAESFDSAPDQQLKSKRIRVALPARLDSVEVFIAVGADSIAARAEVSRVEKILSELRLHAAAPEKILLRESRQDGAALVLLDSLEVLKIRHENRVDPELSPLANALALREQILTFATRPLQEAAWNEEELLLRLLLGIVYPFLLLVILRLTRFGILRWEKNWRRAAFNWLAQFAQRRGVAETEKQGERIINFLTGIERLALYGLALILISFGWFAMFPQTQPLAASLLASIIGPIMELVGVTARSLLLLLYTAAVVLIAFWATRQLSRRRRSSAVPAILYDPVVYFPLRIGIWIIALFFILFPYPGAPRLFAVGVLLIALLAALIALRPLLEEIAAGIYLNSAHTIKTGDQLTVDGAPYVAIAPGLIHVQVIRDEEIHWLPYSKLLKSDLTITSKSKIAPARSAHE
jgi:small-conductance mechanosensitive channel